MVLLQEYYQYLITVLHNTGQFHLLLFLMGVKSILVVFMEMVEIFPGCLGHPSGTLDLIEALREEAGEEEEIILLTEEVDGVASEKDHHQVIFSEKNLLKSRIK